VHCPPSVGAVLFTAVEPAERYVAVQQAYASEGEDDDEDDHETLRDDRVARCLVNCSRGLVELTSAEPPVA